eukprot:TRINITY_DN29040_c0_g1_i2.p1 TRINITY_DN29040_c0_g1~~TRINITY_DN29040_c0_g1_i2.p1  ORF type:complete len:228 (-),score=6.62 TRINITY_DN29040_c0_g1_i2:24-707(-)
MRRNIFFCLADAWPLALFWRGRHVAAREDLVAEGDGGPWYTESAYPNVPIYSAPNFLTEYEAASIVARYYESEGRLGKGPVWQRGSTVGGGAGRKAATLGLSDAYLRAHDPQLWGIVQRIHAAARAPVAVGEHLVLIVYRPGDFHAVHSDDYYGRRASTVIVTVRGLDSGLQGGELVFPFSQGEFRENAQTLFGPKGDALQKFCPHEDTYSNLPDQLPGHCQSGMVA